MNESRFQVPCPYCGSGDTELFSLFGQQLLTVQYYCNACRTPFERVKGDDILEDARRAANAQDDLPGPASNRGRPFG